MPAPQSSSDLAKGKATKPGIRLMEPTTEVASMPQMPVCRPRTVEMTAGAQTSVLRRSYRARYPTHGPAATGRNSTLGTVVADIPFTRARTTAFSPSASSAAPTP
jgi:hypothetical protein